MKSTSPRTRCIFLTLEVEGKASCIALGVLGIERMVNCCQLMTGVSHGYLSNKIIALELKLCVWASVRKVLQILEAFVIVSPQEIVVPDTTEQLEDSSFSVEEVLASHELRLDAIGDKSTDLFSTDIGVDTLNVPELSGVARQFMCKRSNPNTDRTTESAYASLQYSLFRSTLLIRVYSYILTTSQTRKQMSIFSVSYSFSIVRSRILFRLQTSNLFVTISLSLWFLFDAPIILARSCCRPRFSTIYNRFNADLRLGL